MNPDRAVERIRLSDHRTNSLFLVTIALILMNTNSPADGWVPLCLWIVGLVSGLFGIGFSIKNDRDIRKFEET